MPTRSEVVATEVANLLRARNPLLWIVTREEQRVEGYIDSAAASAGYATRKWDTAAGCDVGGAISPATFASCDSMLSYIDDSRSGRTVWIMRDLAPWLQGPPGMSIIRQLRNLGRKLPSLTRDNAQSIVVLATSTEVPPELSGHATIIEWPMPDRGEIEGILDSTVSVLPEEMRESAVNGSRDAIIDAALGLTGDQAAACFGKSLVMSRKIDALLVAQDKKRAIAGIDGLEWFDPLPGGLDAVGGLDMLKTWLVSRRAAFSPEARAYGLPAPRGALLVGIPGCGKSLTAKAVATAWGVPLLKLDLGAIKSKFVGDSEAKLRQVFAVIETIGRCVIWLDEIEKAMAGATDGSADGGVSADSLGAFLSWTQERKSEAFVIATANDVSKLPPELMRKGRFDDVWFVDLPNTFERADILISAMKAHGRGKATGVDFVDVASACEAFTGAEVAALVPDAMYVAFADGARELTSDDLILAARSVVPLAKTAEDKINGLRKWADGKARKATSPLNVPLTRQSTLRQVDL